MSRKLNNLIRTIAALLASASMLCSCHGDREHILKVYNWADYIDEDLIGEFEDWYEEQTGEKVKVVYQLFDINEVMLSKIEKGHEDFDVVCPSDYIIERMLQKDLLIPIDRDFGDTPDYIGSNVSPFFNDMFSQIVSFGKDANDYAVGYMWGTMGFLYNERYADPEDLKTWNALANPKYKGQLFVKDAFRDVYDCMLMYLKRDEIASGAVERSALSLDSSDETIAQFEEYMKSIKDNVSGWEADFGKEQMTMERAWVNFTWSGDASWAIEEATKVGVPLNYIVPDEGSIVWFDGWVIPKYARNVKAASYFINFMCHPGNAVRNMDVTGYVSVVAGDEVLETRTDSTQFSPIDVSYFFGPGAESVCANPVYYPDRAVVERCALMHDSGERTENLLAMWSRIKGDNATPFTFILIIVFIVLYGAYGVRRKIIRNRKRKRRYHLRSTY